MHLLLLAWLESEIVGLPTRDFALGSSGSGMTISWHRADASAAGSSVSPLRGDTTNVEDASGVDRFDRKALAAGNEVVPVQLDPSREWYREGILLSLASATYLDRPSVDIGARPLSEIAISVPKEEGGGKIQMELLISANGEVDGAKVEFTNLAQPFVDSVLFAFRDARFEPAVRRGKPVPSRFRVQASFGYQVTSESKEIESGVDEITEKRSVK